MKKVKVGGKELPVRMTMGAMLRFNRATGKDFKDLGNLTIEDLCQLLYACMQSASKADGIDVSDITLEDFMDSIDGTNIGQLAEEIGMKMVANDDGKEKKSVSRKA